MFSRTQIEQFHRDGIIVARGLFHGEELTALRRAADRVMEDGIKSHDPEQHLYRTNADGSLTYRRSEWMWGRDPMFKAATVNPDLLTHYGQLIGHPFMPIMDSFVCKIPWGDVPVTWHQDPPYDDPAWLDTHQIPNIDADIYLDHSSIENGCLWVIPGHHLVGHVQVEDYTEDQLYTDMGAVPIEMAPGDVSFHCLSAPHGSIGNQTASPRRVFYVHYANEEIIDKCYRHLGYVRQREEASGFFDDRAQASVRNMLDTRTALGFAGVEGCDVQLMEEGFTFTGTPGTQGRYWGDLIAGMSTDEIRQKRNLTYLTG